MNAQLSRTEIVGRLAVLLEDMVQDWGLDLTDSIDESSRVIADLGFESVDLMQLIVAIEKAFSVSRLPWDSILMEDGGYILEITVSQLADFLVKHLSARASGSNPQPSPAAP